MANKADVVARIYDIQEHRSGPRDIPHLYSPQGFVVAPTSNAPGVKEVDVCGVVLRAATNYRTFEIARKDVPMWAGDIIKTAPDTSMAVELLIGARVGVKRGSTVMIGSDGETAFTEVSEGQWRKITLNSGGVYAKFNKHEKPLTIQTRGGVMGIKG